MTLDVFDSTKATDWLKICDFYFVNLHIFTGQILAYLPTDTWGPDKIRKYLREAAGGACS
jgi:hypothetical protein